MDVLLVIKISIFFFFTESFKKTDLYKSALKETNYLKYDCFDYIHQLEDRQHTLDENGKYLIRKYDIIA